MPRKFILSLSIAALLAVCADVNTEDNKNIILATTTSVQDSGLLDALIDAFQKKTDWTVKPIAVGTGQALQMGRQGEADILWAHSPADEKQFVEDGYGINRTVFMRNDFVILGPKGDPAKVIGAKNVAEAFKKIAAAKALFVSRGDNSGTHKKEKAIWKDAKEMPDKGSYIETGQGMARTTAVANEKQGYVLADRATYLSLKKTIGLVIVCEGNDVLINRYSLILANPDRFPKVNANGAKELFNFLLSEDSKKIAENFGKEKFGRPLFFWDLKEASEN